MKVNAADNQEPEPKPTGGTAASGDEDTTPPGNALLDGLKLALKILIWIVVCVAGFTLLTVAILYAGCVCLNGGKL